MTWTFRQVSLVFMIHEYFNIIEHILKRLFRIHERDIFRAACSKLYLFWGVAVNYKSTTLLGRGPQTC
jgi:hypothetical protein